MWFWGIHRRINIGSSKSLLPDGTKPLPQSIFRFSNSMAFTWEQFHSKCVGYYSLWCVWKLYFQDYCHTCQRPKGLNIFYFIFSKLFTLTIVCHQYSATSNASGNTMSNIVYEILCCSTKYYNHVSDCDWHRAVLKDQLHDNIVYLIIKTFIRISNTWRFREFPQSCSFYH